MIERQLDLSVEHVGHGDQRGGRGIRAACDCPDISQDGEVRDRDDVHARVAPRIAVGAELCQQARRVDAGLLGQLALRGFVQRLGRPLEAARDRPHPFERRLAATDEEDVEETFGHRQDDDVDGHGERGELRRVVAQWAARVLSFGLRDTYYGTGLWSCQPQPRSGKGDTKPVAAPRGQPPALPNVRLLATSPPFRRRKATHDYNGSDRTNRDLGVTVRSAECSQVITPAAHLSEIRLCRGVAMLTGGDELPRAFQNRSERRQARRALDRR